MTGRIAGHLIGLWERTSSAAAGALARYRVRLREQERIREARLAEANRLAGVRPPSRPPSAEPNPRPQRPRPAEQPEPVAGGSGEGGS